MKRIGVSCILIAIAILAPIASAQTKSGNASEKKGNSHVFAERVVAASAKYGSGKAESHGLLSLSGKAFKYEKTFAKVQADVYHTGASKLVEEVAGNKVHEKVFSGTGGTSSTGIIHKNIFSQSWEIFSVGPFDVKATVSAGGGAQHSATATIKTSAPRANLNLAAQVYGNAEGSVKAEVLGGLAGASASAGLNFFNTTLNTDLKAESGKVSQSWGSYSTILWQLFVKLKVELLWSNVASKTVVDEKGSTTTKTLL